jgi:uronate dehydrogenase
MLATWLSINDLYRLITASLLSPVVEHSIAFATSDNSVSWWNNSQAKHIGYHPQDSSDVFREEIYKSTSAPELKDPIAIFQGGAYVVMGPHGFISE